MNQKLVLFLTLFGIIVIYFIVTGISQELNEKQYILNTYLYILLGLILVVLTWAFIDETNIETFMNTSCKFFGLIILTFVSLFATISISQDHKILKNLAWTTFVLCMGLMSYVFYKKGIEDNTIHTTLLEILLVMAVLSYIAYSQPLDTFTSWSKPLSSVLCILIIVESLDLLFTTNPIYNVRNKIYSWIAVILFSGFVLYDSQKIILNGKIITELCPTKSQSDCADYPSSSLGLFLDILNLFTNISNIN